MYVFKKVSDYNFLNKGESVKFERTINDNSFKFLKRFFQLFPNSLWKTYPLQIRYLRKTEVYHIILK